MKELSKNPDLIAAYSVLSSFKAEDFGPRPSFQDVVKHVFKIALEDKFPTLSVAVADLKLAEPLTAFDPDNAQPRHYRFMAPDEVMIQRFIDDSSFTLIEGEHRLTTSSDTVNPPAQLVNMDSLQSLINDQSPLLIGAYQQAVAAFWSERREGSQTPFQWLSRSLKAGLNSTTSSRNRVPELSNEKGVSLAVVSAFPEKAERLEASSETPLHAYLVNIQSTEKTGPQRFQLPGTLVVTRDMADRSFILSYAPERGVEQFRSMQWLGNSFIPRVSERVGASLFTWTLYEPEGDVFEALTLTLIDAQLHRIAKLGQTAQAERWSVPRLIRALDDAGGRIPLFNPQERSYLDHVIANLPSWLQNAEPDDQLSYSELLSAQIFWQQKTKGRTFLEGIDALPIYAEQMLTQRLHLDHPEERVDVKNIQVIELTVENLQVPQFNETRTSLVEFALSYRGGWPLGLIEVQDSRDRPVPLWLTGSYVKNLIDELDISTHYIELIKRLLIDDEVGLVERQALFKSQISVQLSMLALEKKIKREGGFTAEGWQVVARLMRPDDGLVVGHCNICVRPLGFHAYEGSAVDPVSNMYVLGPYDIDTGPFILYRPLTAEPLLEFATWGALLEAIKQPGELQVSVLAWFDENAHGFYADGGFERPHLESVLNEGFLALLPRSPAILSTQRIVGDYFEAMYQAHAQALITLADKQTISVSERRWSSIKRYGWSLFNGLTFFISGPLQKAAWIFQTLLSLDNGLQARLDGDKEAAMQTVVDLLFNISLALLHEGLNFRATANEKWRLDAPMDEPMLSVYNDKKPEPGLIPEAPALVQKKMPDLQTPQTIIEYSSMDYSWFSSSVQLTPALRAALDTFAVEVDLTQGARIDEGPFKGLFTLQDRHYVLLDEKAYFVSADADGVVIRKEHDLQASGPRLKSSSSGEWSLDLRLGLRGGSPKETVKARQAKNTEKVNRLVAQTESIQSDVARREMAMNILDGVLDTDTARREMHLDRYEFELGEWRKKIIDIIQLMDEAHKIIPADGHEVIKQNTWARLALKSFRFQNKLEEYLRELTVSTAQPDYDLSLSSAIEALASGISTPYEQWVDNLKITERFEKRLFKNSILEVEALDQVRKRPLSNSSPLAEIVNSPKNRYFDRHWTATYLETLCELLIRRGSENLSPEEQYAFDWFGQGTLVDIAWSQLNLGREQQVYTPEHLSFFDNVLQRYDATEAVCQSLLELNSEHLRNEYLPPMVEVIKTLREFAEKQMAEVIIDSESSSSEPDEPRPGPSRSVSQQGAEQGSKKKQRIITTDKKQMLVGTLRPSGPDSADEIVDVIEGVERLKIHSYRRIQSGEWEKISLQRPSTLQATHVKTLTKLEMDARTLLGQFRNAIASARASAEFTKIPIEMQEILEFKAMSLEQVATQMDSIIQRASAEVEALSDERRVAANALIHNLKQGAAKLREEGRNLRISIIKRLPPTGANVDYLKNQAAIEIVRLGPRKHLTKGQRKDFLQEYVVKDLEGRELWFAHFHYKTMMTPAGEFDVAHLKTAAQRTLSEKALYAKAQSPKDYVEVYRAKLDLDLATRLFLSVE